MTKAMVSMLSMALVLPSAQAAAQAENAVSRIDPLGHGLNALWRDSRPEVAPDEWDSLSARSLFDNRDLLFRPVAGMRSGGLGIAPALPLSHSSVSVGAGTGFVARFDSAHAVVLGRAEQAAPQWWSSEAIYRQGAWRAFASVERGRDWVASNSTDEGLRLGAAYRYAGVEFSAGWERITHDAAVGDATQQAWWVGLAQRVGDGALKLNYAGALDSGNGLPVFNGARQLALGYELGLSPRTAVYAFYTRLTNDPNGLFQLGGGEVDNGLLGLGRGGISLGIRHSF